jgi:hypothetical protein
LHASSPKKIQRRYPAFREDLSPIGSNSAKITRNSDFFAKFTEDPTMIDRLNAKILNLVQRNNRLTVEQIGAQVGLSSSACQRRLGRLRQQGVIRGDVALVDPAKVGKKLTMIIDVTLERERAEVITRFKNAMRDHPQVMQCYYVTGDKISSWWSACATWKNSMLSRMSSASRTRRSAAFPPRSSSIPLRSSWRFRSQSTTIGPNRSADPPFGSETVKHQRKRPDRNPAESL